MAQVIWTTRATSIVDSLHIFIKQKDKVHVIFRFLREVESKFDFIPFRVNQINGKLLVGNEELNYSREGIKSDCIHQ